MAFEPWFLVSLACAFTVGLSWLLIKEFPLLVPYGSGYWDSLLGIGWLIWIVLEFSSLSWLRLDAFSFLPLWAMAVIAGVIANHCSQLFKPWE